MSQLKQLQHLKIPLQDIQNSTEDFDERNFIGKGGYGRVYKGNLCRSDSEESRPVAVKRLDVKGYQGKDEFYTEISLLSYYKHENIVGLVGFCDDSNEMILVYEYMSQGSLDTYLSDAIKLHSLSWSKRLKICVDVARALDYLHNHVAEQYRIIHRDVKSANVLLDENWNAKISDFGLSRIGLANQPNTFLFTNVAGTQGYCDPQYEKTGILTKESDVYSFGVVLFEVLCGRLVCVPKYHDERRFLQHFARLHYRNNTLDKIIDHRIRRQIKPKSLLKFSDIAFRCLQEDREDRPTMDLVVGELTEALEYEVSSHPSFAARRIQENFRSHLIKRSRALRAVNEFAIAKGKMKELKGLFDNALYRDRLDHDEEEKQRYCEKVIALLLTLDSIEGAHVSVRSKRKPMMDKLQEMLNEMVPERGDRFKYYSLSKKNMLSLSKIPRLGQWPLAQTARKTNKEARSTLRIELGDFDRNSNKNIE